MPAVTKYDLYSDFIQNNKYPKDPFFDNFRKLQKDYVFIDTKKLLSKALYNGVKDVFYVDDTHWSRIACDIVSNDIIEQINKEIK